MSKSREALDREKQLNEERDYQSADNLTEEERTALGGQTNYGIGRESRSDFPRRSVSSRERDQFSDSRYRNQNEPYSSTQYNRQSSARENRRYEGRTGTDRSTYDRANAYQNRQWPEEDSGDFYSQGIRERIRTNQYEDQGQSRGYRSNEQGEYSSGYRATGREQGRDWERRNRTSSFDSPSQRYEDQTIRRSQTYDDRSDDRYDDRRGYGRRYEAEAQAPRYDQTGDSYYGMQPWLNRGGETYAYQVRCRDLMTRDVTTCTPDTSLRSVAEMMEAENVGSIPVIEGGRLIGLVTDRDIVCRIIAEGRDTLTTTAREAMTDDLVTCMPDELVVDAIHKMGESQVRRIPVCDPTGRLRGILSVGDVALEAERDHDVARALEQISQPSQQASRRAR